MRNLNYRKEAEKPIYIKVDVPFLEGGIFVRVEQITNAGMQQTNSPAPAPQKTGNTAENKSFEPQEVFIQVEGQQIKIGEYPPDSSARVEESVEHLNRELKSMETNLRFSIHKKTKQIMVKIVDTNTSEVIREIPSEKILDMVAAMMERAGLFLDKRG